jgi:hypothetical protein
MAIAKRITEDPSGDEYCRERYAMGDEHDRRTDVVKLTGTSTLVTTAALDLNVYKSARNIDRVTVSPVAELNALSVLTPRKMLVTKAALDAIAASAEKKAKS